jgi:hypothetical protein
MDHENVKSIFHDATKNKMKVASILIQQSVRYTKSKWLAMNTQQGHLGSIKMIRKSKKSVGGPHIG